MQRPRRRFGHADIYCEAGKLNQVLALFSSFDKQLFALNQMVIPHLHNLGMCIVLQKCGKEPAPGVWYLHRSECDHRCPTRCVPGE